MSDPEDEPEDLPEPSLCDMGADTLPMPHLDPVAVSSAGAGEGVSNPTNMDVFSLSDEFGVPYAALWRWHGDGYDPTTCWFEFDEESLVRIQP